MLGCTLASAVLCVICGYLTAQVSAQRINEVLETRNSLTRGTRTDAPGGRHRGVPGCLLPLPIL